ncbi:Ubiquitin family protein [Trichomonas vaginalis G3]|uniref:Ubiquitin family protein n=1 Tax=Trichomonas vaginalis (strain ATCC PRA-98 / G3) TaxID=412133 RepID=A2G7G9_TRIV3|nr:protein neddylation [Trichomonas vaginalis G3]XP_051077794.1 protein neddylation [Trichomonas vaginalis G3]EAX86903.1 Ubiquitin family protein [Trichomonas vaginalis G3]KAI5485111.1 protein neddylation [Trichomonas vaginalis G3]KAI5485116.1 protein neddylation [Trichomonas vaginalis G3]|eukprot:XP_001299833.1 Ubiquitin family protein [Trichomonas vaginalis G3]
MLIYVHTVSGRKHQLEVEPSITIAAIKEELLQREGISIEQQRLLFRGQNLTDNQTVETAHISAGEVLHMVLALRAG